ncbi:HNH endonuclease [Paratractidigestivibacter sp.]|uniref:HNH endonuclease n=1 Tax=Paratractidigestivibacter sp. TaxID=2847316 RepID=UPI002AC8C82F|nr:HNH endonuclease [Paratractidigestivibacter sp.]
MSGFIRECEVMNLSLERAFRLIPEKAPSVLEWYRDNEGQHCSALPLASKTRTKDGLPLCRQSGIYAPSSSSVRYKKGRKYALAVHSSRRDRYADKQLIHLGDGTWIFEYARYDGPDTKQGYNEALMNCLEDGVPVGVIVPSKAGGYTILGLAYVEHYNSVSGMFTLHGPVNPRTESQGCFCFRGADSLTKVEQKKIAQVEISNDDMRRIVTIAQVRREQQDRFRKKLLSAYGESCAITETKVPEVLQAAHIKPYRGKHSQIVNNGILLRADMHLLFDAHLISINPDNMKVQLSGRLAGSNYRDYLGRSISLPLNSDEAPSIELIGNHYEQFLIENRELVLA